MTDSPGAVSAPDLAGYSEATELDRPRHTQLAHLSVEVGHFYMEHLVNGEERIHNQFSMVAPWLQAAVAGVRAQVGPAKPRISTCFLIDDYFGSGTRPADIVPKLVRIAEQCGITIDYLVREAGCARAGDADLAGMVRSMLLPEPPEGTNGSRPPLQESGWLCNGQRSTDSPTPSGQAMQVAAWRPPVQFGARRTHSIFVDVELWRDSETTDDKLWSCPFLAAIWHLLRLGMLRYRGEPVAPAQYRSPTDDWPERWNDLPAVMKINPAAAPFAAYRSVSIMPRSYLVIENAVEVILNHLDLDPAVTDQVIDRGKVEGLEISRKLTHRMSHIFIDDDEEIPLDGGAAHADRG
ncbi:SCO2522 family protein [Actinophytocola sp.]|uniref:SCO2522 family protein n=1 Tax=Actinophytocola sp. TaxID=1872138 RepID=UPI002D804BDA|nr:SCO2522 family protein [Actinophytocola sp.]HET9140219.1 SCO2522 family protein [Actinophytocola sp.]